ncbi:hypothetical protein C2G38_2048120 [Gigaspora rosea]|uniref:Uncharacterized protein n=1 Tax=Gigaspora rosea TaxID=44941 RepID=A0A397U3K4_9GLOM|nr:hypothetical protein C2G38_2048120 [Gigaspora rosea]
MGVEEDFKTAFNIFLELSESKSHSTEAKDWLAMHYFSGRDNNTIEFEEKISENLLKKKIIIKTNIMIISLLRKVIVNECDNYKFTKEGYTQNKYDNYEYSNNKFLSDKKEEYEYN